MRQDGHALVNAVTGEILAEWGEGTSQIRIDDPTGDKFTWQDRNWEGDDRKVVERWLDDTIPPGHKPVDQTREFDGAKVTITNNTVPKTAQEIDDEDTAATRESLRNSVEFIAMVLTDLIDGLIEKGAISAADFDLQTRQKYLKMQAEVAKIK